MFISRIKKAGGGVQKDYVYNDGVWNPKYTYNNSTGVTFLSDKISLAGNALFYTQNLPLGKRIHYLFKNVNFVSSIAYFYVVGSRDTGWVTYNQGLTQTSGYYTEVGLPIDRTQFLFNGGVGVTIEITKIWIE